MGVIKTETFDVDIGASGSTHTLSNSVGSTSSAFIRVNSSTDKCSGGPTGSTGNTNPNIAHMGAQLTGTTTLTFNKNTSTTVKMIGEVWRYTGSGGGADEFITRGHYAVTLSGSSATQAVSGIVDRNDCVPFITGINNPNISVNDYDASTVAAHINSSGDLIVSRQATTGTLTVYVSVVEFTGSNWSVGHGFSGSHDSSMETVTLNTDSTGSGGSTFNVGNWEFAFLEASMEGDTAETGLADVLALCYPLTSTSQVRFGVTEGDSGARNDGDGYVHAIVNSSMIVKRDNNSNLSEGNGTYGNITSFPIGTSTSESIDELGLEWFATTSGTGTAHVRGRLNARITNATGNIQHWVHRSGNTVAVRYGVIDLSNINGTANAILSDFNTNEQFNWSDTNLVLTGSAFEATQGTGKVEFWSDTSGTIKVSQTIDSWSDTSIQIDPVQGSLGNNVTIYLVVTADSGATTNILPVTVGLVPYDQLIENLLPNHYWKLQNNYNDSAGVNPMTTDIVDGGGFVTTPLLADGDTHAWRVDSVSDRRGCADSSDMNITTAHLERTMGGWIRLGDIQQPLAAIYKEGGGVNNLCFLTGYGNTLVAQLADTSDDNVQAYSDFKLNPDRNYHIMFRYSYLENPKEFTLFIDGIEQQITDGNPLTSTDMDSHSGDVNYNDPDTSLEMGGTDITFNGRSLCYYAHWCTWKTALDKTTEIYDQLFERGALPDNEISTGTESAMQTSIDAYADTVRPDAPLAFRINEKSGGGDLRLELDNITFNERVSLQIQWTGTGTLTLVTKNGSQLNTSKFSTPAGGTITVIPEIEVKVTAKTLTGTAIQSARVLLEADSGGPLAAGTEIMNLTTDVLGEAVTTLEYTSDQPITGRVRKSTSSPYYRTTNISATITSDGLDLTSFLISDE